MILRVAAALVCLTGVAVAEPRTVRGVVTQSGTVTPVAGASVLTDRGAVAATDVDGFFAIDVPDDETALTFVANGYLTKIVRIGEGILRVELARASGAEVIEVSGKAPEETNPLSYQLSVDEIRAIPGAGNDIMRAITVLPGVARIPFSFGGLVLRGTSPRDTSVYLDGVEVPIAFHFGGITSFYPSGMLADLAVTSGGFDASWGRTQGGIISLTTREPRPDRWRMGGSVGLFDSSVQAEGPWKTGGILIGLRRSYLDAVADPFVADDIPLPSYWDFQIRTTFGDPRKARGRFTPLIFSSIDRVASDEVSVTSAFVRVAVPYLRQIGPTTVRVVPWLGTNRLTLREDPENIPGQPPSPALEFSRPVYVGGVRGELTRDYRWGHLRGGAEVSSGYLDQIQIDGFEGPTDADAGESTLAWTDGALWAEARYKLDGDRFAIKPGLRVEGYALSGEIVFDPRINIHQKLTDRLTLRQALGRFHQPPIPADVDPINGNPNLDSSYIDQASLGLDIEFPSRLRASLTGFYAYGRDLGVEVRRPEPGSMAPEPNRGGLGPTFQLLLEKQLGIPIYRANFGRARSYGLELSLKRNVDDLMTILSYTLALSERTDDPRCPRAACELTPQPMIEEPWRPFELDQRHNLQLAASIQLAKWRLGGRLQIVSGNPYSPYVLDINDPDDLGEQIPWGGRLPMFFSVDLRADRRWHRCWGDIVFFIDLQNATNQRNVEGREVDVTGFSAEEVDIRGLPLIPFLGVEFLPLI